MKIDYQADAKLTIVGGYIMLDVDEEFIEHLKLRKAMGYPKEDMTLLNDEKDIRLFAAISLSSL